MSRDEVFEHRHTLFKVRDNRVLNNGVAFGTSLLGFTHQTTHTGKLLDLVFRTTGTRIEHHEYGIETLVGLGHFLQHNVTQSIVHLCPGVNYLVVALVVGGQTHAVVVGDGFDFLLSFLDNALLGFRDDNIVEVERQTCGVGHAITEVLNTVEEFASTVHTYRFNHIGDNLAQGLLLDYIVEIAHFVGDDAINDNSANRSFHAV